MKGRARRVTLIFLGIPCLLVAIPAVLTWRIVRLLKAAGAKP